ncbi:MAG TPA: HAMP domain-containing sensor histidine kinase [Candidatus Saccharimonadales bacterium]|nr:HAMP domain-containing sensor histidine kinase [Candidatus Saccharimonadales bacterium]
MVISLTFSVSLYQVSSEDLGRNVNRQLTYFNNFLGPQDLNNYSNLRLRQLNNDLKHLRANLFLFNAFVLIGGGAASYWLARRTLRPIESALAAQSRFAADASHELRTPLTAMQTENEVALRSNNLTKKQATELLKSNLEEVGKLKSLSEGLLRLAGSNQTDNLNDSVPLKDVVSKAMQRFSKTAAAKHISIDNKARNFNVRGDADSLTELISIFIDNAIKYSPSRSTVILKSWSRDKTISLSIADNGQGIAATELPYVFDRFYRTDNSRTKNQAEGYGLGLAIAQKITEAHHGHIEVSSLPGKGSTFIVHLPAA